MFDFFDVEKQVEVEIVDLMMDCLVAKQYCWKMVVYLPTTGLALATASNFAGPHHGQFPGLLLVRMTLVRCPERTGVARTIGLRVEKRPGLKMVVPLERQRVVHLPTADPGTLVRFPGIDLDEQGP